jgi:peroxin-16
MKSQQLTRSRAWIHSITGKLKNKPLLDMVGSVIEDYEYLWDQYYFPTATL